VDIPEVVQPAEIINDRIATAAGKRVQVPLQFIGLRMMRMEIDCPRMRTFWCLQVILARHKASIQD